MTNLIFASDWQQPAHHLNWWKADIEAENIFLAVAIGGIVLSTACVKTRPLPRSP